jgi:hypothetical protein
MNHQLRRQLRERCRELDACHIEYGDLYQGVAQLLVQSFQRLPLATDKNQRKARIARQSARDARTEYASRANQDHPQSHTFSFRRLATHYSLALPVPVAHQQFCIRARKSPPMAGSSSFSRRCDQALATA